MTIANTLSFLQNSAGALTTGTINASGAPVTVSISGSEKIRVDTNGYLLVNYSSSVGTYHLQVQGNVYFSGNLTAANLTVGSLTGSITTATNLAGGAAGQLHYQINPGVSGFVGPGTAGQILVSGGSAIPVYTNTSSIYVGYATQVNTVLQTANASYFPTFVDTNNATATAETVYTTSSFTINPLTGNVGIGTTVAGQRLTIEGTAVATATVTVLTLRNSSDGGVAMSFTNAVSVPLASISALVTSAGAGTDDGILAFSTAVNGVNTERVRIDASGNIILNGITSGGGSQFIMRGGTGASSEGPQIILGYGNNVSSAITGQANNTWNIDVASGVANNDLRIFRQNNAGATAVAINILESNGGVQILSLGVGTPGSGTTGEIRATNEITAYYTSDARLKENVTVISSPIEKLEQIRGVYFDWTDEHVQARGGEDGYFVRKHDIGVIAQEVEAVLPEIVATRDNGYKAVKYEKIVPLLIECIKEQQTQINQILERLEKLANK
jgi:hypothetical protein